MKLNIKIIVIFLAIALSCSNQNIVVNNYDIKSLSISDGFFSKKDGYFLSSIGISEIRNKLQPMQYLMNLNLTGKEDWLFWDENTITKKNQDSEIYTEILNNNNQIIIIGKGLKNKQNYIFTKKYNLKGKLLEKIEIPIADGNHIHDIKLANVIFENDRISFLVGVENIKSFLLISINEKGEVISNDKFILNSDRNVFKRIDFIKWNGKDKVVLVNSEKKGEEFKDYLNFLNINDNDIQLKFIKELPNYILNRKWLNFRDSEISLFTKNWFYNITYEGNINNKNEFKDLTILFVLFRSKKDCIILATKNNDKVLVIKILNEAGEEYKSYEYSDLGFDRINSGMMIPGKDEYLLVLSVSSKNYNYDIVSFFLDQNGKYKL